MADSEEPVRKRQKLRSPVWNHFTLNPETRKAQCILCPDVPTIYSYLSGSTSVMIRHLQNEHGLLKCAAAANSDSTEIENPVKLVCRLLSLAGLPFATVAQSDPFRDLLNAAKCSSVPSSPTGVRNLFMKFAAEKKRELAINLRDITKKGRKLSLCTDEWTSCGNRRYVNVNLHDSENRFWNLGLGRIKGSFTAEACQTKITNVLSNFGVSFERDIFGVITDGASVMKKFGRESGKVQQLCMAHGIHLAVLEVFYKRREVVHEDSVVVEVDEEDEDFDSLFQPESSTVDFELAPSLSDVVEKVRKTVKLFKKSPLKEEILKNYVLESHGRELTLILDVRTRWNSVLEMLERFEFLRDEVCRALLDLGEPVQITDEDFNLVKQLIGCLKPVKLVVEALCRRDANLISCDVALRFMMRKVSEIGTTISTMLYDSLKRRILERRSSLANVLFYLNTRKLPESVDYFEVSNKKQIIATIKNLAVTFMGCETNELVNSENSALVGGLEDDQHESLELQLNNAINIAIVDVNGNRTPTPTETLNCIIKKEIALFENGGTRGRILESVFQMAKTIKPTSVESERVFSSSTYFCTRVRSRLADSTLDSLVFMRTYFKNIEN